MTSIFQKMRRFLIGPPRNPLNPSTRRHVALIALFAWIGLGADGLSSSAYGPEEAFLALGQHHHLALYLAVAMAITVFIISLSYNQVIELFPNGGGGYKVATKLLNPYLGLFSGAALIVDYVLTISISIASAVDALFSLLPVSFQEHKLTAEGALIIFLMVLNLRGMKESIKILMPIFLGFVVTHVIVILYGIFYHLLELPHLVSNTMQETHRVANFMGWPFTILLLLKAYSLGGGTYTGLEAVSNNVNTLAEPRVTTGKWTMFYMATSLSLTAAGITLLYLLWQVEPVAGRTLNAVVFSNILANTPHGDWIVAMLLLFETGLLFVGANTGFLGGPATLANMALDGWVPNRFRNLSSRLVTQNGIILFGIAALLILLWSNGKVSYLVVLYSIGVFVTFSISLLGLCKYWLFDRPPNKPWFARLLLSFIGFIVCASILIVTTISKLSSGGWFTLVLISAISLICHLIKKHYQRTATLLEAADRIFHQDLKDLQTAVPPLDPKNPTAVFFIGQSRGAAMHTILWAQRLFPSQFKNFVFVRVGVVEYENFNQDVILESMQRDVEEELKYFVNYAHQIGVAAKCYRDYGIDPVDKLTKLAERINDEFPNCIFFACQLLFTQDNWIHRFLHNETATSIQRCLHLQGMQMVILPMKLS